MVTKSRSEILKDFRNQISQGKILVGVGAGTGITAKCSEKADPCPDFWPMAMPIKLWWKWATRCCR